MNFNDFATFARPSRLERKIYKRSDADFLENTVLKKESRLLLFWKGMPMVDKQTNPVFLIPEKVLVDTLGTRVFLGSCDGIDYFAGDITRENTPLTVNVLENRLFDPSQYHHPDFPEYYFKGLRMLLPYLQESLLAELLAIGKALLGWHYTHRYCSFCGHPSDIKNGGWSRICPACKSEHFPRCDPVVIMLILRQNKVLLGRSYHWPQGMHSLLAGFMEPGESIESAVVREVYEEAEILVENVSYLSSQPWPFPTSLMIGCRGEARNDTINPQKNEIENAIWLEREEVMDIYDGSRTDISLPRKGSIAEFLIRKWLGGTLT